MTYLILLNTFFPPRPLKKPRKAQEFSQMRQEFNLIFRTLPN